MWGGKNSLNLNLKGGKLIILGNQCVLRQKCLNLNLKSVTLIKLGNQGAGEVHFLNLNFIVSR